MTTINSTNPNLWQLVNAASQQNAANSNTAKTTDQTNADSDPLVKPHHHHRAKAADTNANGSETAASDKNTSFDPQEFITQFTKDFGDDAGKDIVNTDGSINFAKVKTYFDSKVAAQDNGATKSGLLINTVS